MLTAMRNRSRFVLRAGLWIAGLAITLALILVMLGLIPLDPGGRFRNDLVASEGPAYFEIAAGKVELVVLDPVGTGFITASREVTGTYSRQGDQWVFVDSKGKATPFRTTVFSLTFELPDGKWDRYPRMWIRP